jgi:hypothetical protein
MTVTTDGKVFVKGYVRADGTRVESYYRDPPPSGKGSIGDISNQKQLDAAKKAAEKANAKALADAAKKAAAAAKAKAIKDALNAFALDSLDAQWASKAIEDALLTGQEVTDRSINKLSQAYDDAFKSAEAALKLLPDGAEKVKLQKEIAEMLDAAVYDAELGVSKYGTGRGYATSPLATRSAVSRAKANAGGKLFKTWGTRSDNLLKAINGSKDAAGNISSMMLSSRLNELAKKPGMSGLAKTLTQAEKYALNSRGMTVSGRKFKAPDFRLNGDQSLKPMLKTMNTMEKAGNPILKQKAADLAKVGVTQSAKTGAWTVTKTGLKAAGRMLPVAAGVLEATDRLDRGKDVGEATRGAIITTIASIAGSAAGGAVAGSVIPGAGTLGGFIFGLVGGIGGAIAGGWGSDRIDDAGRI